MNARKTAVSAVVAVVAAALFIVVAILRAPSPQPDGGPDAADRGEAAETSGTRADSSRTNKAEPAPADEQPDESADSESDGDTEEEPKTEEELREAEEEKKVDAFDALTDKWMEPSNAGVTMKDVDEFSAMFRNVPKERKDECLHRALNLIPDENVMLLAGILMDKTQDKELVELVYNDVLNRDEDVKKPILQQIFKDKSHPCWADTAWILDVTDELPGRE